MPSEAAGLVRRYFVYGGLYTLAASVIWGVNTLFLLDAGLSIGEVFIANSAFSAGTMLFELPTGVAADTLGRRASFLLSIAILGLSTLGYVALAEIGGGVVAFSAVSVLLGLGFTFYSGAMDAWLVDGVKHLGYDGPLDRIFGRSQIVTGSAMLVGTVGGGVLGQWNLAAPFVVRSVLLGLLFVAAFIGMRDLGFEPKQVRLAELPALSAKTAAVGVRFASRHRSLRLLIAASAIQAGFMAWAWYAWQPYFLELLDRDAVWIAGVVAALLAVSMMIGNAIVEIVMRTCGRRTTLFLGASGVFTIALVGVGVANSFPVALALLCLAGVTMGVQTPVRQSFINQVVPTDQRATVLSVDSMMAGGGGVVGQTSLGALSERSGFSAGYIIGGSATLIALPLLLLVRREGDAADGFGGSEVDHACATPSAPALAQVAVSAIGSSGSAAVSNDRP